MKARNPETGEFQRIKVRAYDNLPIGTEVDFEGDTIPEGWEEIEEGAKVLWSNPNPRAEFASQTITLSDSLEDYEYYEVLYLYYINADYMVTSGKIPVNYTPYVSIAAEKNYRRGASSASSNTITFNNCIIVDTYGGSSTTNTNNNFVPYKVIAYKDNTSQTIVDKNEVYSTTEQRIGTWIDGSDIYRRVFTGTTGTSASDGVILNILDNYLTASDIVQYGGYIINSSGARIAIPSVSFDSTGTQNGRVVTTSLGILRFDVGTAFAGLSYKVWVDYVKLTTGGAN